jgi:tetratricopeptide (TPR) repeat protein
MRALRLITAACLLGLTPPALAQEAPQSAPGQGDPRAQAKVLFEQATADYKVGRFDSALSRYEQAHKLFPAAQFLFNIAQCHRALGNYQRAIFFFEGYLREAPAAPNKDLVEDLIRECREKEAALSEERRLGLELEQKRLDLAAAAARPRLESRPGPRDEEPRPLYKKWWFWAVVGGVALTAAGTAWVISSSSEGSLPDGSLGNLDWK